MWAQTTGLPTSPLRIDCDWRSRCRPSITLYSAEYRGTLVRWKATTALLHRGCRGTDLVVV